jgi:DNA-binding transcriptional MerR regulator
MRIGELSAATGVSASRIRFYETAGLLAPDGRTATGYRVYGESAVQALRVNEQAQMAGFTLAEIKGMLPTGGTGEWNREGLLAALREKLTAIEELQKRLSRTKSKLREVIDDIESAQCGADHVDRIIASLGLAGQPLAAHDVLSGCQHRWLRVLNEGFPGAGYRAWHPAAEQDNGN